MSSDPARVSRINPDDHEREMVLNRQRELQEHRRKVREFALKDVRNGMSALNAAVTWGLLRSDLERWVDEEAVD